MILEIHKHFSRIRELVKKHRQLQLALLVIVLLPLLYVYSANTFLNAGQANQVALLESSAEILHDAVTITAQVAGNDRRVLQRELNLAAARNNDLLRLELLARSGTNFTVLVANQNLDNRRFVANDLLLSQAMMIPGQTVHSLEVNQDNQTVLVSARLIRQAGQNDLYVMSEFSLARSEAAFTEAAQSAYLVLLIIYLIVLMVAIWHVRATSYYDLFSYTYDTLKSRRQFTHMIAHELRTPLTAIRGYSSMLSEQEKLPKKTREHIVQIQLATDRISSSVGALLDVARVQSGSVPLEITSVDVPSVVVSVLDKVRPNIHDKSVSLVQSGELAGVEVETDKLRLQQILVAVVQHAIDNIDKGSIEVDVRSERHFCKLRIKTMGDGLATHNYKKVFAPFFTSPSTKSHETLSSGLESWIARQYIDLIGARVSVESIKDVGTHVVITIPRHYTEPVI